MRWASTPALNIRMPDAFKAEATAAAKAMSISLNALLLVALRDHLDRRLWREQHMRTAGQAAGLDERDRRPVARVAPAAAR